jgi:DNA-binding protein Fis
LNTLRNSYDIALYSLDENLLKEVDAIVGEAQNIAAEVLSQYREYVRNKPA